jgi:hypothetical protein
MIDDLASYKSCERNSVFDKWHKDVEINLGYIFRDDNRMHIHDFKMINFRQKAQSWADEVFEKIPPNDYLDGLQKSKALLLSYIDEINNYWKNGEADVSNNDLSNLKLLLFNFHKVVMQLLVRHDHRNTIEIIDEYDVQDLIAVLLHIFFDDIRQEEYTPSYAGGESRIDFLLNDSNIALEIKKTRSTLTDKQIGDQLLVDISRYKSHPKVRKLICFIYDPDWIIRNRKALVNDLIESGKVLQAEIFIVP